MSRSLFATGAALLLLGPAAVARGEGFALHLAPLVVEGNYLDSDTNSSKLQE